LTTFPVSLRILGVEDGSFDTFNRDTGCQTLLCGVLMEGDTIVCICQRKITIDGLDATDKLVSLMKGLDIDVIILGGITFGGFNVIDPKIIHSKTGIPVVVYSGKRPDNNAVLAALKKHFPDWNTRWNIIIGAGKIYSAQIFENSPEIYYEAIGCNFEWAKKILKKSAKINRIPEPVRVSRIIARGLTRIC
jgi:endonuclease V-like protein UPF0215 family